MRVRITKKPPAVYESDEKALLVGRVYNLAAPLASALMLEGCAELYETMSPEEKRQHSQARAHVAWTADDRPPRWLVPGRTKKR